MWTVDSGVLSDTVTVLIENNAALGVVLSFTAGLRLLKCFYMTHCVHEKTTKII